ncbi:MAG: M1 family metallopeptidase [Ignavibacteriaceae bacterium]
MKFQLKVLLLSFLVFNSIIVFSQGNLKNKESNDRKYLVSDFQKSVDILHYDLSFDLNTEEKILTGIARLTSIKVPDFILEHLPKDELNIELNFYDNLEISSVNINDEPIEFKRMKNRLFVKIIKELSDTFIVEIKYSGTPQRGGFDGFVFGSVNGNDLVYNISEPNFASTWFPCDDDPSDKAMLDIRITNDSQFVSVSNGKLLDVQSNGPKKTYHYKTYYPISPYLVAVYSAPYKTFNDVYVSLDGKDSMSVNYYAMPEHFDDAKIDFGEHVDYLQTLSQIYGEYPFINEKYGVAEFLWNYGAMENQTITGVGYSFIGGNNFFRDTYVHELAHHWWGNSVGPKTWNDIWLNEGFATYSEALYNEAKNGKDALKSTMQSKFSDNFKGTLYAPRDLFSGTIYEKGAWVLHMLRYEIGDSNFFSVLHNYYYTYKFSNASVEDFKSVCEKISGMNLDKFFDQWVYTGTENIFCSYNFEILKTEIGSECSIKLFQEPQDYEEFHFPLEIEFQFADGTNEIKKVYVNEIEENYKFSFDKKVETISLDPDSKLLATFEKSYSK